MSKKDRVISEETVNDNYTTEGKAAAIGLGLALGGPVGALIGAVVTSDEPVYKTTLRDEDNNEYVGRGKTEAESKGDAYSKMK